MMLMKKDKSLRVENKKLRVWVYILLGVLTLICFFYHGKLNLYKWVKIREELVELKIFSPKGWRINR